MLVAKAPADGYTLLLGATTMVVSPHMQAVPPFDDVDTSTPEKMPAADTMPSEI